MKIIEKNKGVIIFYLILVLVTMFVVQRGERNIDLNNRYVYLSR